MERSFEIFDCLTWIPFCLLLTSSISTDQSLTTLVLAVAAYVKFMTFFTVEHVTVHSLFARLFLRTLSLVISRRYHLEYDTK